MTKRETSYKFGI